MNDSPHTRQFSSPPSTVLYHAECADGFGAAWAIWKQYPSAKFIPVKHGNPPPGDLTGQRVVIVDFSYSRPILESMAAEAKDLIILDHHITAEKALTGLPYAYFDLKKSGAVLGWEWAHGSSAPWLLQYIQDKDLWNWALPGSREINAAIASYPFDFQRWDGFIQSDLEQEGRAILRYEQELVGKLAAQAVMVDFQGLVIPAVHSAILTSQVGERLSPHHPFCLIWHDRDGRRYFSMRSREDGTDVGTIAASFGGGGHTHAAGFSIPLDDDGSLPANPALPKPVIDRRRSP
ncbi:DHHA1 domain-containing protein [Nitrospira sp. NS4]|uniref:DHHA1 domain-containing protein n=1 Tax=Nitrospira sp. NS4 TaxID=3414498 RepID=UPI003C2DA1C0